MSYPTMLKDDKNAEGLDVRTLIASQSFGTIFVYAFLFAIGVYTILYYSDIYFSLSLFEFIWNALVYITPSSLVLAFEKTEDRTEGKEVKEGTYASSRTFNAKSKAMRRILGLNGTGVLTNVQRARSLSGLGSLFKTLPNSALPGLGNWDNSCYQNSVLQGLSSLPSLYSFLLRVQTTVGSGNPLSTNNALRYLIEELNATKNAGRKLWTPPALKNMSSWQQQDAQEYYSKVVDEMEKEITKTLKSQTGRQGLGIQNIGLGVLNQTVSREPRRETPNEDYKDIDVAYPSDKITAEASIIPKNPLEGLLAQRVGCLKCGFVEGLSMIPFNCLTVPLGRQMSYDIRKCLDDYTALEPINGVECANCTLLKSKEHLDKLLAATHDSTEESGELKYKLSGPTRDLVQDRLTAIETALGSSDFTESTLAKKCKILTKDRVNTTKSRQAVIARAPQALVIHINRSLFDEYSGMMSKNYASVRFPKVLDLSSWCLGGPREESEVERWTLEPSKSMLVGGSDVSTDRTSSTQNFYILRALVTHYGRHENGHYIAYRQRPSHSDPKTQDPEQTDFQWWRLSDEDVSNVSEEHVLAQEGVFMLFYEQIDLQQISTPEQPVSEPTSQKISCSPQKIGSIESHGVSTESRELQTSKEISHITARSLSVSDKTDYEDQQPKLAEEVNSKGLKIPQSADTDPPALNDTISTAAVPERHSQIDPSPDTFSPPQRSVAAVAHEIPSEALQSSEKDSKLQIPRMRTSSKRAPGKDEFDRLGSGAGLVPAV